MLEIFEERMLYFMRKKNNINLINFFIIKEKYNE